MDVLFINPCGAKKVYQQLAKDYSAIETPTWSLLLAQSCRSIGYDVGILDADAERLSDEEIGNRVREISPRLACFVVYGQNPNSGTTNMVGAVGGAAEIKKHAPSVPVGLVGSHVQALPLEVLEKEESFDIVFTNEGVYALWNLLALEDLTSLESLRTIRGIGFRENGAASLMAPERIVPQAKMDEHLPGYAWDLLPYREKPLDLYRSHFWHGEYNHDKRTPFAALYTSLGCQFKCSFCMINILNRNDNDPIGVASNYSGMRFWSPEFIIKEFDKLVEMGVETIRISDEMFLLHKKYYVPLCNMLKERGYGDKLRMWAYSRIDTVRKPENLKLIREAGIRWLCLGIESADRTVRIEATKGKFKDVDITEIVKMVHDADIEIIANYIFGLPEETHVSMQKTQDLSLELCTMAWNTYPAMALPGSRLYKEAIDAGIPLPTRYEDYSFHSYEAQPLPTEALTPAEIIKFRDDAWHEYHAHEPFLQKVEDKFGLIARENIEKMSKIRLKRRLLEENDG